MKGAGRVHGGDMFVINFHGIGDAVRRLQPGEGTYWISPSEFDAVLDFIASSQGIAIDITFDDGNISDYAIAAPKLKARGLSAMFFVLAGKLGEKGYLSVQQVRDLSDNGFQIGSHGSHHLVWTTLSDKQLSLELMKSKSELELITGREIQHVAIPYGRYNRRVLQEIGRSGYRFAYSSDGGPRLNARAMPIPRRSVTSGITLPWLQKEISTANRLSSKIWMELRARVKGAMP